jgi:hypothetical protein
MTPKNWRYFSLPLSQQPLCVGVSLALGTGRRFTNSKRIAKLWILAGLIGTIASGCRSADIASNQPSSEVTGSSNSDFSSQNVRVENTQKVDLKGNNVRVSSRTSSTTEGVNTQSESSEKNTEVAQIDATAPKIANGRYWVGGTDQALEVAGDRYRYDTEGGDQPWQNIANLKYVKNGVIFDGKTYWCLSTLAPNPITGCGSAGWSR